MWAFETEDAVWADSEPTLIMQKLNHAARLIGQRSVHDVDVVVFRVRDASFEFYSEIEPVCIHAPRKLWRLCDPADRPTIIIADGVEWQELSAPRKDLTRSFEVVDCDDRWFRDETLVHRFVLKPAN